MGKSHTETLSYSLSNGTVSTARARFEIFLKTPHSWLICTVKPLLSGHPHPGDTLLDAQHLKLVIKI